MDTSANEENEAGIKVLRYEKASGLHSDEANMHRALHKSATETPHNPHIPSISPHHMLRFLQQELPLPFSPPRAALLAAFPPRSFIVITAHSHHQRRHKGHQEEGSSLSYHFSHGCRWWSRKCGVGFVVGILRSWRVELVYVERRRTQVAFMHEMVGSVAVSWNDRDAELMSICHK